EPSPQLPAPKDVKIYSYNFQSWLRWSPVEDERGLVLYTVEYKTGASDHWSNTSCTRIPQTECAFPSFIQRRRWTVTLRVRAELGQITSDWNKTEQFVAELNTTLGPPKVTSVSVSSDSLLIGVAPPFTPEAGDDLHYLVSYWENTTSAMRKELKEDKTLFKIGNLKELTLYCFSIQVELATFSKDPLLGQPSGPECHSTDIS
ncbi:Interferon gamma receptor 2, partial [Acanthisitta chloris]